MHIRHVSIIFDSLSGSDPINDKRFIGSTASSSTINNQPHFKSSGFPLTETVNFSERNFYKKTFESKIVFEML